MEVVFLPGHPFFPCCVVCMCLVWWAESDSSASLFCLCGSPALAVTLETRSNYSLPECENEFIFQASESCMLKFIHVPKSSLDTEISVPVLTDLFSNIIQDFRLALFNSWNTISFCCCKICPQISFCCCKICGSETWLAPLVVVHSNANR